MHSSKVSRTNRNKFEDRIWGTLYGHCIGDAIGLLSEFMTPRDAKVNYGKKRKKLEFEDKVPDMHRERWDIGDWTDDSDQMILIMQSLIDNRGKVDPIDIAKRLLTWKKTGFAELGDRGGMGIGATTVKILTHPDFSEKPQEVAHFVWDHNQRNLAPNGGVMRTSVVGLLMYHNLDAVVENAKTVCTVTHADPRCQASCVGVCVAIAMMMQAARDGRKVKMEEVMETSYRRAADCIPQDAEDRKEKLKELRHHMFASRLSTLQLSEPRKIGYTYKCMGAGFWALRQSDSKLQSRDKMFRSALEDIVFAAGDADTNGAVAGALLGCRLGQHNLPQSWLTTLKHKAWLDNIITQFIELVKQTSPSDIPHCLSTDESPAAASSAPDSKSQTVEDETEAATGSDITQPTQTMNRMSADSTITAG